MELKKRYACEGFKIGTPFKDLLTANKKVKIQEKTHNFKIKIILLAKIFMAEEWSNGEVKAHAGNFKF